jgi:hypothetical protein
MSIRTIAHPIRIIRYDLIMKKLQPGDEIVKIDEALGIAWILLPPDDNLGGFRGISPRILDEGKFIDAKNKTKREKR